jgi:hypothetical protein
VFRTSKDNTPVQKPSTEISRRHLFAVWKFVLPIAVTLLASAAPARAETEPAQDAECSANGGDPLPRAHSGTATTNVPRPST